MLNEIENLNPEFYPMALDAPQEIAPGRKHFDRPVDGFITKADFMLLYDASSELLHTRNPDSTKDPTIQVGFTVPQWVARIQRLLTWHKVQLINGGLWIVNVPDEGNAQGWPAAPVPSPA